MRWPELLADAGDVSPKQVGFRKLYTDYFGLLTYWILSKTRNRDAADDLVAATFARAWEHWDELRDPAKAKPWLYTIAYHELSRWQRHLGRMESLDDEDLDLPNRLTDPGDFTEQLALYEQWQRAAKAATRLSQVQRRALALAVEGLSQKEAARKMGVPQGTAGRRLMAARRELARRCGKAVLA